MEIENCLNYCKSEWSEGGNALEGLKGIIKIPNLSPAYDDNYFTNGLVQQAILFTDNWIKAQGLAGLTTRVHVEEGREPLLIAEIPAFNNCTKEPILTYGHLDKMPHLTLAKWSNGLGPVTPVIKGDYIYGRGSNDDCYNPFFIVTIFKYLQKENIPHPKVTILLETGEESGDETISHYLKELRPTMGDFSMIIVLDGLSMDYANFWIVSSLRGCVIAQLDITILDNPVHSGAATGIVPSTFRITRQLLSRIEDEKTGEILLKEANLEHIPDVAYENEKKLVQAIGNQVYDSFPLTKGAKFAHDDDVENLVANHWKPGLAVTGADGIPAIKNGSNIIRTTTSLKLSLRVPPGIDAVTVGAALKKELERDPPYNAKVSCEIKGAGSGWCGIDTPPEIWESLCYATNAVFKSEPINVGDGASIPLTNLLTELWPKAKVFVIGAAGPDSNPHGYDESLNLTFTYKLNAVMAAFIAKFSQ